MLSIIRTAHILICYAICDMRFPAFLSKQIGSAPGEHQILRINRSIKLSKVIIFLPDFQHTQAFVNPQIERELRKTSIHYKIHTFSEHAEVL